MLLAKIRYEIKLFERHIRILKILYDKGPLGILKLSYIIRLPPSQVRYSLRILQQTGLLQPTTKGAKLNQRAIKFLGNLKGEKKKLAQSISSI